MLEVLRVEKKYCISSLTASCIMNRLSYIMDLDSYGDENGYRIRTLYFDSIYNDDYYDKIDGLNYRKKIRLRKYVGNDNLVKLEMKEKEGSFQRKRSLLIKKSEALRMLESDYTFLKEYGEFGKKVYALMSKGCYRPVSALEYQRKAFVLDTNNTRITFDWDLRVNEGEFNIFDDNMAFYPVSLGDTYIMEVKYNHFLMSYIKDALGSVDKLSLANSKYCQSRKFGLKGEVL